MDCDQKDTTRRTENLLWYTTERHKMTDKADQNDRELLELAAKATGDFYQHPKHKIPENLPVVFYLNGKRWNPLTDDGDALRLAVKLNLAVTPYPIYNNPKHSILAQLKNLDDSRFEVMEMHGTDPYAATRRCITRAAAEIGKTK
jgi:hypothetical protein